MKKESNKEKWVKPVIKSLKFKQTLSGDVTYLAETAWSNTGEHGYS